MNFERGTESLKYSLHRVEEKLSVEVLGNTECSLEASDFNFDKSSSLHVFFPVRYTCKRSRF